MTEPNTSARILIAGGTGFLGQRLAKHLIQQGVDVGVLGRAAPRGNVFGRFIQWDGRTLGDWHTRLDGASALVNSWIHELDMNRLFEAVIQNDQKSGVYNATAPNPVSNREFMRELRRAVHRPLGLPTPELGVRLASKWVMRTDPELALYGRYVIPKRLTGEGFVFQYPLLKEALQAIYTT